MASSTNATAHPDSAVWRLAPALILGFQGLNTILYAGLLPPPISPAGIDLPFLGHVPFVWLGAGLLEIVAAVGVLLRQPLRRYLGIIASVIVVAGALTIASSPGAMIAAFVLPAIVLFSLFFRWQAAPAAEPSTR